MSIMNCNCYCPCCKNPFTTWIKKHRLHKLTYQNENVTTVDTKVYTNAGTKKIFTKCFRRTKNQTEFLPQWPSNSEILHQQFSATQSDVIKAYRGFSHYWLVGTVWVAGWEPVFQWISGSISCICHNIERQIECSFHTVTITYQFRAKLGDFLSNSALFVARHEYV